jgi:hypothetical protein
MHVQWVLTHGWFAWSSIVSLSAQLVRSQGPSMLHFVVWTNDGRRLHFADTPTEPRQPKGATTPRLSIDQLVLAVAERSREARLRAALERYDRGEPVEFEQFTLSRAGVSTRRRALPWPHVAGIYVDPVYVVVSAVNSARPWRTFNRDELPNADILADVAAYAERVR